MRLFSFFRSIEFSLAVAWVILIKACIVNPGIADGIFFLCAVANIIHERYEKSKEAEREALFLDQNLTSMQNQLDTMKSEQVKVLAAAEEAKKLMTETRMSQGFTRPKRQ